ncbi:MAG TPA: hypothetical protein VI455_09045 [Terriglobia bacterium]
MKEVKFGKRRSVKGTGPPKNVDENVAGVPEPAPSTLGQDARGDSVGFATAGY